MSIATTIETVAGEPISATSDGLTAVNQPIAALIAADQYLTTKTAVRKRRRGLIYAKLLPSGALSDNGRTCTGYNPCGGC